MLNFAATQLVLGFFWGFFGGGVVMGKVGSSYASAMASRNHLFYHPFIYLYPDQSVRVLMLLLVFKSEFVWGDEFYFWVQFWNEGTEGERAVSALPVLLWSRGDGQTPLHSQAGIAELLSAGVQNSCMSFFKIPSLYHLQDQKLDLKGA